MLKRLANSAYVIDKIDCQKSYSYIFFISTQLLNVLICYYLEFIGGDKNKKKVRPYSV